MEIIKLIGIIGGILGIVCGCKKIINDCVSKKVQKKKDEIVQQISEQPQKGMIYTQGTEDHRLALELVKEGQLEQGVGFPDRFHPSGTNRSGNSYD